MTRQARLKPEYAGRYPGLIAGVWLEACSVAASVQAMLNEGDGERPPRLGRVLDDQHFEFRGGVPRGASSPPPSAVSDPRVA